MSYYIPVTDHFCVSQRLVNTSVIFCDCVLSAFSHFTLLLMWPPGKKWRHSASKRTLLNFEISFFVCKLIMLCNHMKKYKVLWGIYEKKFTFSECLGKNHKTHNLILQFLLVVKNNVEQNIFFWCFIEDANMLYYYRKKYFKSRR